MTPNEQYVQKLKAVTDPLDLLQIVVGEPWVGDDPYYREFNDALHDTIRKVLWSAGRLDA